MVMAGVPPPMVERHSGASSVACLERVCGRVDVLRRTRRNVHTIRGAAPGVNHRTCCRGSLGSASLPSPRHRLIRSSNDSNGWCRSHSLSQSGWAAAAVVRIATASATVATITGAGFMAPIVLANPSVKSWTLMETLLSVLGLVFVLLLSLVV